QNYVFIYRLNSPQDHLMSGSANAHYIRYMYADFGLVGVGVVSFLVGTIPGAFEGTYVRLLKIDIVYAMYVISITLFWKLMGTQPTTVLVSHGAIVLLVAAIL